MKYNEMNENEKKIYIEKQKEYYRKNKKVLKEKKDKFWTKFYIENIDFIYIVKNDKLLMKYKFIDKD